MPNLEIVTTDEDTAFLTVKWNAGEEAFITCTDRDGFRSHLILQKMEAQQLIAALSAFVAGKDAHRSDCALHSSPAYPIEPCNCG